MRILVYLKETEIRLLVEAFSASPWVNLSQPDLKGLRLGPVTVRLYTGDTCSPVDGSIICHQVLG